MNARCWLAALALLAGPAASQADEVLYIAKPTVDAAFAVGRPLTENAHFKVHASRRDAAGLGEVHVADTDVIYVLSGHATLVTGGALVDAREVAPRELRGARIDGGEAHALAPGDVIVVPNGTPHWFAALEAPFTYYVVKVTDAEALR